MKFFRELFDDNNTINEKSVVGFIALLTLTEMGGWIDNNIDLMLMMME